MKRMGRVHGMQARILAILSWVCSARLSAGCDDIATLCVPIIQSALWKRSSFSATC